MIGNVDEVVWICDPCGRCYGRPREGHISCWHYGRCAWCGNDGVAVTEPRDFGYPSLPSTRETE